MDLLTSIMGAIESESDAKSCEELKRETKIRLRYNAVDAPEYLIDAMCVAWWNDEFEQHDCE